MKRLLNMLAWTIVFVVLGWFYSYMKKDIKQDGTKKEARPASQQIATSQNYIKIIKVCGSPEGLIIRGSKVFCKNGTLVEGVDAKQLSTQP